MQIINYFYNFLLAAMSGITILGLSSSALLGVTGAAAIFFLVMIFDIKYGSNYFNRRI